MYTQVSSNIVKFVMETGKGDEYAPSFCQTRQTLTANNKGRAFHGAILFEMYLLNNQSDDAVHITFWMQIMYVCIYWICQ